MEDIKKDSFAEKMAEIISYSLISMIKDKLKEFNPNDTAALVLTPAEAAERIGVSKTVMYNDLLKREDFPSYRLNSKFYISKKGLQEWVDNQVSKK